MHHHNGSAGENSTRPKAEVLLPDLFKGENQANEDGTQQYENEQQPKKGKLKRSSSKRNKKPKQKQKTEVADTSDKSLDRGTTIKSKELRLQEHHVNDSKTSEVPRESQNKLDKVHEGQEEWEQNINSGGNKEYRHDASSNITKIKNSKKNQPSNASAVKQKVPLSKSFSLQVYYMLL